MTRRKMPDRRASWTQRVVIGGITIYATFGEYEDGSLGEVFLDAAKQETFLRGILGALARMVSLGLQHGLTPAEIVGALRGLNFPPNGPVTGSPCVVEASSLVDWLAREIELVYCKEIP